MYSRNNNAWRKSISKPPQTKEIEHRVLVTLDEIYNGAERRIRISRYIPCGSCLSRGCSFCQWKTVVKDDVTLTVNVPPGIRNGHRIIHVGDGNQDPGMRVGDVVLVFEQQHHNVFKRRGDDLLITMRLALSESICGFTKNVTTLDARDSPRQLRITNAPGRVIKDNELRYIVGEGMPIHNSQRQRGNLIIKFKVDLPSSVCKYNASSIEECLPSRPRIDVPRTVVECNLVDLESEEEDFDPNYEPDREVYNQHQQHQDPHDAHHDSYNNQNYSNEQNGQYNGDDNYADSDEPNDQDGQHESYANGQYNQNARYAGSDEQNDQHDQHDQHGQYYQHESYASGSNNEDNYYQEQFDHHEDIDYMEY